MNITEIQAKSLLRKGKKVDSWFICRYGMNLYRGCEHNCVYCDGRAEGYYVEGDFEKDVAVKINAIELLRKELSPKRKRTQLKRGFVVVGGGVGDSYQPIEEKYQLARKALEVLYDLDFPVHMLTKSTLIYRDIDILKKINEKSRAIISFSFSSANDEISSIFEPNVPAPSKRLETINKFKREGFHCGMFLMPVIPFITDTFEVMEDTIKKAKEAGIEYIVFGGMTLKEGRQKEFFINTLKKHYPQLLDKYNEIYIGDKWGSAVSSYYISVSRNFSYLSSKYHIPRRIPPIIYRDILDENDLVVVMLEQLEYLLKRQGKETPYGYAAYSISKINEPLSNMKNELTKISGVGKITEKFILEILETHNLRYLEKLLNE